MNAEDSKMGMRTATLAAMKKKSLEKDAKFMNPKHPEWGRKIGRIEDEWSLGIIFSQQVYDEQDRMLYHIDGYPAQPGLLCPCYGATFWILDPRRAERYGQIRMVSSCRSWR